MVQFLDSFRGDNVCQWMGDHIEVPVLLVIPYVAMVLYIPDAYMKNRKPFDLRQLNMAWNLLLTVFSTLRAYYCLPQLYRTIFVPEFTLHDYINGGNIQWKGGMYNAFCYWDRNIFFDGPVGAFVCLFILSKIPEMLDTAFLVFQKKPVRFLHWFHHVTTMLYCWHAYMYNISGGLVFAGMNYGVHSIMYFYYFICSCGYRKYVRPFAPFITLLQIAQMVVGMFTEAYTLYILSFTNKRCDSNAANARLGFMMYMSYFILFSKLFYDSYLKSTPPRSAAAKHNDVAAVPNGGTAAMKKAQ
ncbi:putative fatty acid elongase [Leishmania mexicana MHOM/GT/2001/U1103]|uniref:Elongation of fatty acids protein n=1 Tax=Leishmania mexicana (strain MHOM/GT/2001/U1103) TaxID=929439 RepID=E9APR3_LEIMU|nr:putative fatty acid elongase [Leishmania mexicana MHOM/GT/2001/U1103]CBZ24930.1 putative fatty acid elongase [Leishmania mexicana MHOM/GT/2001/U1103]